MRMADFRKAYGVPAKRGMRVTVYGQVGTITSAWKGYLRVRFDISGRVYCCHPTDGVVYEEAKK